jgi:16S rRNA (guanine1207-N2)-methyltransferase
MSTFHLGGRTAQRRRTDSLRGGAVVFESPRGLARPQLLLVEALPVRGPARALFGMDTEGAVALAGRALWPETACAWFHLDAYAASKVRAVLDANGVADVDAAAAEDPPAGPFDLVALPFPASGEALLMRDLVEAAHDALRPGGRLIAATDRRPDALRAVLRKVFGKAVPARPVPGDGACFYATRTKERAVRKDRSHVRRAEIADVDGGTTLVEVESRPGTFSHGAVDRGTRALAEWWRPRGEDGVLDLGAGCGTLGLVAAKRLPEARVLLVDSNERAVGCARRNVERNGLAERVEAVVRADLEDLPAPVPGGAALCLANPPYFGGFRIAASFVGAAFGALRPGGRLALVTRSGGAAERHAEIVRERFGGCQVHELGAYAAVTAVRREPR